MLNYRYVSSHWLRAVTWSSGAPLGQLANEKAEIHDLEIVSVSSENFKFDTFDKNMNINIVHNQAISLSLQILQSFDVDGPFHFKRPVHSKRSQL